MMLSLCVVDPMRGSRQISSKINESLMWPVSFYLDGKYTLAHTPSKKHTQHLVVVWYIHKHKQAHTHT